MPLEAPVIKAKGAFARSERGEGGRLEVSAMSQRPAALRYGSGQAAHTEGYFAGWSTPRTRPFSTATPVRLS